jgi:hypothetical protein
LRLGTARERLWDDNRRMNQTQPKPGGDNIPLDESRWYAWVLKNRQRDKAGATRRVNALRIALFVAVLFALFRNWMLP